MIISCSNISKSFGEEPVLKNVSFHVNEHEKAAIVGINGAGKSTLLKIIMGEMEPDTGTVTFQKGITTGYLAQHQDMTAHRTIYDEVLEGKRDLLNMEDRLHEMEEGMEDVSSDQMEKYMAEYHRLLGEFTARNGYAIRSEVSGVLKGLGFGEEDFGKYCDELSGGQKTRVSLARLLVTQPDLILLDEPTNHLDIESITWLETFLLNYKGAVIIVAHDRYFLDRIVSKVIAISRHEAVVYQGNYTEYAKKARERREAQMRAYYNQQREIAHQEQVITRLKQFNREKSIKRAESREKALSKMEVLEKPQEEDAYMKLTLTPEIVSGNDVLTVSGLSKSFGDRHLFSDIDFEIKRGERVALIGANGTGKTTMLKIINEKIHADSGSFKLGTNVSIGYYDQEQQNLHMGKTLIEEISDEYPTLTMTKIRNVLAAFLFTDDDAFKRVEDLSGGERGRLSLAKLMLSDANFLILDEPTNHLDMESKEILESALNRYEGTVLFVSHDRYFINQTATRILHLTGHRIVNYIGNYDYYMEKRDIMESKPDPEGNVTAEKTDTRLDEKKSAESDGRQDWKAQKARQAEIRKRENHIRKLEEEIEKMEEEINQINEKIQDPSIASNSAKLNELSSRQIEIQSKLDEKYDEWEKCCS